MCLYKCGSQKYRVSCVFPSFFVCVNAALSSSIFVCQDKNDPNNNDEKVLLKTPTNPATKKDKNASSCNAVIKLFLNVHYGSWIAIALFAGICNGIIWGFLNWHLDNLGMIRHLLNFHIYLRSHNK